MLRTRIIQIVAIVLILLAGYLWSQRLAVESLLHAESRIQDSTADQLAIVRQKVTAQTDPYALIVFGRKLLDAGNPQFAIIPLEKATLLLPKYRDGWYLLGYAYAKAGQVVAARSALERAKAIDPNYTPSNQLLDQLKNLER